MTSDRTQIDRLRQVQELDQTLRELQSQADAIPKRLQAWQDAIQSHEIQKAMFARQREDLVLKQKHYENEIAAKQEIRAKYNQQLTLIKTNREYRALLEELEGVNNQIRSIEDIVLDTMTGIDAVDQEMIHQDEAIAEQRQELAANEEHLMGELGELQGRIDAVRRERDGIADDVDAKVLRSYERVRNRRDGNALVPIDPERGTCGGCHMALRPQEVNEVLGGTLVQCQTCGRLLYHEEESTTPSRTH